MAGASILNVDDYLPGRYARTKLLRQADFSVIEAGSGKEAFEMAVRCRPALVLLDVNLPDMSGIEVCRMIRQHPDTAALTILHISASNVLTHHQVLGLDSGADGYIVEPVEPSVLIATINAFLRARRAEEALLKSTEELRWFSYRVAHDLREPLRTITVYSELLAGGGKEETDPNTAKLLGFIGSAAERMRAFIDGLLEYSQAANAQTDFTTFECEPMVVRVIANLHAAIEQSGARITYDDLPAVVGDIRLEYVFQNLIGNAIKYGRKGVPPEIHLSARQAGGDWLFSVQDNGVGIEPQYLDTVFEVFRRLHGQEVPGNGIGLALSRKIVEAHGGKIWIESQPGVGSTFYFTIPNRAKSAAKS